MKIKYISNVIKEVDVKFIEKKVSDHDIYLTVVSRLSHDRLGNFSTKTRSEVSGGGKKPWRQKGLGRARVGSIRSPLWRGGGIIFGPKPRDLSKNVNKKVKSNAYIGILNRFAEQGRLFIIDEIIMDTIKTKEFIKKISNIVENINEKIVIILENYNKNIFLSSRNIPNITVMYLNEIDILPLVYAEKIYISNNAINALEKKFSELVEL